MGKRPIDLFQAAPPEARTHHRPAEYISSIAVSFTVVLILASIVAKRDPTFKAASLLIDHLMSGKLFSVAYQQTLPIIMDGSRETSRRVHASCVGTTPRSRLAGDSWFDNWPFSRTEKSRKTREFSKPSQFFPTNKTKTLEVLSRTTNGHGRQALRSQYVLSFSGFMRLNGGLGSKSQKAIVGVFPKFFCDVLYAIASVESALYFLVVHAVPVVSLVSVSDS